MSDGGGQAYGGSDGSDISVAGNPAAMTDLGFSFDDITAAPASPGVGQQILDFLGQFFGITPAAAAGIYNGATLIGFINITLAGPQSLSSVMAAHGLTINPNGTITNSAGAHFGTIASDFVGVSLNEIVVQVAEITGPASLDTGLGLGTISNGTETYTIGGYTAEVWGQINNLAGCPITRALPAPMPAGGYCSGVGVQLMNYTNILAMYSKEIAFLSPEFVGGLDGIYSLRTGQRVVPPPNVGTTPRGFSLGSFGTFARTFVLLGVTTQGRGIILGEYGDPIDVIDPSTGAAPDITFWAYLEVFDGSQQIQFWPTGEPLLAYTGPAPTLTAPGYNMAAGAASPILALTGLLSSISTVISPAAFATANPGYNYGGPG